MKIYIYMAIFFVLCTPCLFPGGVMAIGTWNETIDETDLQGGAGSDIPDTYESNAAATSILITGMNNKDWAMTVEMSEINWHGDFTIYLKRTDNSGGVSGGTTYQVLTTSPVSFCTGSDNQFGIRIQYQLEGVSLQIPADTYSITVTYTVTET
jgi:hypothetical protein